MHFSHSHPCQRPCSEAREGAPLKQHLNNQDAFDQSQRDADQAAGLRKRDWVGAAEAMATAAGLGAYLEPWVGSQFFHGMIEFRRSWSGPWPALRYALSASLVMLVTGYAAVRPNDAELTLLMVGEWQGGRHAVQYFADGTYRWDPEEGTTHGKWRISRGRLIDTWRFIEESKDRSASYEIVALNRTVLKLRDADGKIYEHVRLPHPLATSKP